MGIFSKLLKSLGSAERSSIGTTPDEGGAPIYAVGDIHGCLDLLRALEDMIAADSGGAPSTIVFLGDYIDRGPDSRGVIEHLARWPNNTLTPVFLMGNHEQVLLDFLQVPQTLLSWSQFGGLETLLSYGLRPKLPVTEAGAIDLQQQFKAALPDHHLAFLSTLRTSYATDSLYFAHAGVNPALSLDKQTPKDLLWIRDEFLGSSKRFAKRIVHGHTPGAEVEILPQRINVDTGAYITGKLSAVAISGQKCRVLTARR